MGMLPDLIGFNLRCAQLALFQHFGATVGQDAGTSAVAAIGHQIIDRLEDLGCGSAHIAD